MPEILPEQSAQLSAWVVQRDALLLEISALRTEEEKLKKSNRDIAESNTDIENRINQSLGRIEEITKKEDEFASKVSQKIDSLTSEKASLESSVDSLRKETAYLTMEKSRIIEDISTIEDVYERVFNRAAVLDDVVNHVTRVSQQNLRDTEMLIDKLKGSVEEVISTNNKNVEKANVIINELPRIFFELQRQPVIKIAKTI